MKIDISFDLPFLWCADCEGFDPEVVNLYDGIAKAEIHRCCRNAYTCEAHEAARRGTLEKAVCKNG